MESKELVQSHAPVNSHPTNGMQRTQQQQLKLKRPRPHGRFQGANNKQPIANLSDTSHLSLPIHSYRAQILESLRKHQTTIIVSETGSGKSTQLPQILANSGLIPKHKGIVCTQPRRVAAVTIAQKVASERGVVLGQEVGYSIRFEDKSSPITRIKYATDGVLLRESMSDPLLSKYSIVIIDEAHERSLQTDILLGLIKMLQAKRGPDDLKIVIMSATLQVEAFTNFFKVPPSSFRIANHCSRCCEFC
jgi:HrpA-like RNA helicase